VTRSKAQSLLTPCELEKKIKEKNLNLLQRQYAHENTHTHTHTHTHIHILAKLDHLSQLYVFLHTYIHTHVFTHICIDKQTYAYIHLVDRAEPRIPHLDGWVGRWVAGRMNGWGRGPPKPHFISFLCPFNSQKFLETYLIDKILHKRRVTEGC